MLAWLGMVVPDCLRPEAGRFDSRGSVGLGWEDGGYHLYRSRKPFAGEGLRPPAG